MTPEEAYRKGVEDAVGMFAKAHPMWAAFILKQLLKEPDDTKDTAGS